ncbi:MAG: hypothetical protein RR672_14160 [Raoultibacter sp.]
MKQDIPKIKELTNYVMKRVHENCSDGLNVTEEAWQSSARDVVEGIMRSCAAHPENGIQVVCDSSNNPQFNIDNNILSVDVILTGKIAHKMQIGNDNAKTSISVICKKETDSTTDL